MWDIMEMFFPPGASSMKFSCAEGWGLVVTSVEGNMGRTNVF